jgi:hypothetical protein
MDIIQCSPFQAIIYDAVGGKLGILFLKRLLVAGVRAKKRGAQGPPGGFKSGFD